MDRGLRAQLSPNEETALRRIAAGAADQGFIALRYLEHLAALNLIEAREGAWQLTKYGEMRVAGDKRDSS